ncbi:CLUMA_CG011836, isoform A [Clunio marinus]|uniref:CLUMA_CG011836, isoform A n=1 Tax=Clunio marinus TaxID=568069 RepID=A0A1J1IDY1_9DIPT|nr:CLUMA_CG011836, isoform A [Clunio marinus]
MRQKTFPNSNPAFLNNHATLCSIQHAMPSIRFRSRAEYLAIKTEMNAFFIRESQHREMFLGTNIELMSKNKHSNIYKTELRR